DFVQHLFAATTHDYLMFFTATGRAYVEKVYEIPEMGRAAKGRSIANILELKPDEKIAATIRIQSKKSGTGPNAIDQTWDENLHMVAGENGIGNRTGFDEYRRQSRGGKGSITTKTGEKTGEVVGAPAVRETDELMLITNKGQMVRTRVKEIRETGRNTMGVKLT